MAYSKFSYEKLKNELGIIDVPQSLFEEIKPIEPAQWLTNLLQVAKPFAYFSEKSRSEGIVFPILLFLTQHNQQSFSIYSGADLPADESKGLSGECDFILGAGVQRLHLDAPLFCMMEAKDESIKNAIPQCIAQMEGARIYNEKHGKPQKVIYGCATTGVEWQLLKLENNTAYIDTERYYLANLPQLLGALQNVLNVYI
jgi:hypothetical protein